MNRPEKQDLLSKALRKGLNEAERKKWDQILQEDPGLREEYGEEMALERALDALPNVPISSNFTALVLQAAAKDEIQPRRLPGRLRWPLWRFASSAAVFVLVGALGFLGYRNHSMKRAEMALNVRSFTEVASVVAAGQTSPEEVFENFDAIRRLSLAGEGEVDMELLVALQK